MDPLAFILYLILAILVAVLVYMIIITVRDEYSRREKLRKKYGRVPDHTELYFEEYFPTIMKEWDIVSKSRLQRWKKSTRQKMSSIDKALDDIMDYRKGLNTRLDGLEKDVSGLEKKK